MKRSVVDETQHFASFSMYTKKKTVCNKIEKLLSDEIVVSAILVLHLMKSFALRLFDFCYSLSIAYVGYYSTVAFDVIR